VTGIVTPIKTVIKTRTARRLEALPLHLKEKIQAMRTRRRTASDFEARQFGLAPPGLTPTPEIRCRAVIAIA
jgi:hypothetical protein